MGNLFAFRAKNSWANESIIPESLNQAGQQTLPWVTHSIPIIISFLFPTQVIERNVDPEVTLLSFLRKNWILLIKVWAVSMFALKLQPAMIMKTNLTSPSPVSSIGPCCLFTLGSGFKDIKLIGLFGEDEISPELLISGFNSNEIKAKLFTSALIIP